MILYEGTYRIGVKIKAKRIICGRLGEQLDKRVGVNIARQLVHNRDLCVGSKDSEDINKHGDHPEDRVIHAF